MQRLGKLKSCCRGYSTYSLLFSFHPPEIKQRQAQLYKHSLEDKKALKLAMKNSHLKTGTIHFFLLFVTPHSLILHTMTLNIKINVLSMLSALKRNWNYSCSISGTGDQVVVCPAIGILFIQNRFEDSIVQVSKIRCYTYLLHL